MFFKIKFGSGFKVQRFRVPWPLPPFVDLALKDYISEWILMLKLILLTGFTGFIRILFYYFRFPEETEKAQSAFSGNIHFVELNMINTFLQNYLTNLNNLKTSYLGTRWKQLGLVAFFRKATNKNPVNPV
jgi:hypothetical protein